MSEIEESKSESEESKSEIEESKSEIEESQAKIEESKPKGKKPRIKHRIKTENPDYDVPRIKIIERGPRSLSLLELMAVVVSSGNGEIDVFTIAKELTKLVEKDFHGLTVEKLQAITGIGRAKATQIIGAIEFSRRFLLKDQIPIENLEDVLLLVRELRDKKQEYFLTLTLDGAHNLIEKRIVFIGTLNESLVHPREVFADAITDHAAAIILVHNHTSNNPSPSPSDIQVTKRLVEVSEIMGIEILDHLILTKTQTFSFKNNGLL